MTDYAKIVADLRQRADHYEAHWLLEPANAIEELASTSRLASSLAMVSKERSEELEAMLREMVSQDGCSYDHDMYCQTHYRRGPCVHERARAMLGVEALN